MPAAARGKMPAAPWLSLFARYRLLVTDCSLPTARYRRVAAAAEPPRPAWRRQQQLPRSSAPIS